MSSRHERAGLPAVTPSDGQDPLQVDSDDAVGQRITQARSALGNRDVTGTDQAYSSAVTALAAAGDPARERLRWALAGDHVAALLSLHALTPALQRCVTYEARPGITAGGRFLLCVLRAEVCSAAGAHAPALTAVAEARRLAQAGPGSSLRQEDEGRLLRLEGLAAASRGEFAIAEDKLARAQEAFAQASLPALAQVVDNDRQIVAVRQGDRTAMKSVLSGATTRTLPERLRLSTALKRDLRYEEALAVLTDIPATSENGTDLDPAWRFPVLAAQATLLILTHQEEKATALIPALEEAVEASLDPQASRDELAVLSGQVAATVPEGTEAALQHARRLIAAARLQESEDVLRNSRDRACTVRERAVWHLAAGELELALAGQWGMPEQLDQVISHLERAVALAAAPDVAEVRSLALRLLGRACNRRPGDDRCSRLWAEAHRIEERIATRQLSDEVRLRMLQAAADEHDERIRAAVRQVAARGPDALAGLVLAMESGRTASLLAALRPGDLPGDAPAPDDLAQAWRWVRDLTRDIPRSQLIWLQHATPERIHHVLLGRGTLHHASYRVSRASLIRQINNLVACWSPQVLELSIASGEFDRALEALAGNLGVDNVLPAVPGRVSRIAVVAAGELADIPYAALPLAGTPERLLDRFAISDLPGLEARRALRLRVLRQRGDAGLLVSPPADGLSQARALPGVTVLSGTQATPDGLAAELATGRARQVRIDCHGRYDQEEQARSWLQLAPAGSAGRLDPATLERMDLSRCGTLVLGACESGMTRRRGRDERAGFVRSALLAGAGSVLAARWVAEDSAASEVLDRYQLYLRCFPRDAALRRAQLDLCRSRGRELAGDGPAHPGRWACWSVCGDAGLQTQAGPLRRQLRKRRDGTGRRQR